MRSKARFFELFLVLALVAGLAVVLNGKQMSEPLPGSDPSSLETPLVHPSPVVSSTPEPPMPDRQRASDPDLLLHLPLDRDARSYGVLEVPTEARGISYSRDLMSDENSWGVFGHDSYISVGRPELFNGLEEFTLEAWVRPTVRQEHLNVISKVTPHRDFNLQVNVEGRVLTHIAYGDYEFCYTDQAIPLDNWTHVVATYKDHTWSIYLDGKLSGRTKVQRNPAWSGGYLTVGNLYPGSGEGFVGGLDDVKLFRKALTPDELKDRPR